MDTGEGYLHPDAKDQEGAEPVDYLLSSWAQPVDETGGIGITDIDQQANKENGYQKGAQVCDMHKQAAFIFVRTECKDDRDSTGAGGHGEGNRIKEYIIPACGLGCFFFAFDIIVSGEQLPAHAADHDTPGQLDNGNGNAKQLQDPAAYQCGYGADDKTIEGYFFCSSFSFLEVEAIE